MKKFLFLGALAAMLLGTASCSNEMEPEMTGDGNVQFTIELPGNIDSRAISDGLNATKLQVAVYKEDGTLLQDISLLGDKAVTMSGKKATVNFKLVKGLKYSFAFWAQNPNEDAYTFDATTGKVKVDYSKAVANADDGDAFSNREMNLEITGPITKTITLTRPFAQLNYGDVEADYEAAVAAGIDFSKTQVTVKQVSTEFDVMGQKASSTALTNVTWPAAVSAIADEELNVENVDYKWLSMCYFLVPNDQANVETELSLLNTAGTAFNTIKVNNVPVQKNHRTNILGNLFTDDVNFNVIIDQNFLEPDFNIDPEATVFNVTTKEEFDAALVSDAKKIVINLPEGEIEYTAGYFYPDDAKCYGGPNTESITIIGKGIDNTTINGVNTYRSWFNTKNPDCVVTLKNLTATSSGNSANTWDGYDCAFSGPLNVENVKFLKPVALSNEGKKTYFKNVYIDATNTPSEAYALWVCAGTNVTLEDCTFNGVNADPSNGRLNRGIKISDQYSYNGGAIPTMTYFNAKNIKVMSDKKAAILVGTVAGATIAIDGIDLTEVAAEHTNAVHIDNGKNEKGLKYTDYMNLVTVTGATCIVEP